MHIKIIQPSPGNEENAAVSVTPIPGMIAQGPGSAAFEEELATCCSVPHAVAGKTPLHTTLLAAEVAPTSPLPAAASAVPMSGAVPVFGDLDPTTTTIDLDDLFAKITPETKAMIVVHLHSQPCYAESAAPAHPGVSDEARAYVCETINGVI